MLDIRLYMFQRLSAMAMIPFVLVHLGVMIYAIQGGLSAAEILGRTQGSVGWFLFYGLFVAAAALHGSIGLAVIVSEWAGLAKRGFHMVMGGAFLVFLLMGARAVWTVTLA
ncbi:succinate dehydrogenase [Brevirhabdus sp.]|uniref:succinate dehydrogenase n=1 Tax=Brevirhabdus sp. TaxID=2004514 RepID=UPI0040593665